MKKVLLTGLLLMTIGCTKDHSVTATTQKGEKGDVGSSGLNGQSCSVSESNTGATFTCPDGTTAFVKNGSSTNGSLGPRGDTGQSGLSGSNGHNSIIKTFAASKEVCSYGGLGFLIFIDMNDNYQYDENIDKNKEISYLCSVSSKEKKDDDDKNEHNNENDEE